MIDAIAVLNGTERLSKRDFLDLSDEDLERLHRAQSVYGSAMAAYEFYSSLPPCDRCGGEHGYADESCIACRKPLCSHCMDRHEEREECAG